MFKNMDQSSSSSSSSGPPSLDGRSISNKAPCRICTVLTELHYHYGVQCCKACSQFFIRTVNRKKKFEKCRNGGKCHDESRMMPIRRIDCKDCRFQKCLSCGMNPHTSFQDEGKLKRIRLNPIGEVSFLLKVDVIIRNYQQSKEFEETLEAQNNTFIQAKRLYSNMLMVEKYANTIEFFGIISDGKDSNGKLQKGWKDQIQILNQFLVIWLILEKEYGKIFMTPGGTVSEKSLDPEINKNEMAIIKHICFCDPDIFEISEETRQILTKHQENYTKVLWKYCRQYEDSEDDAVERIQELFVFMERIQKMKAIHFLKKDGKSTVLCVDEHPKWKLNGLVAPFLTPPIFC